MDTTRMNYLSRSSHSKRSMRFACSSVESKAHDLDLVDVLIRGERLDNSEAA